MALRGIKPQAIEKRLKAFFYGMEGVGKTTAAISFPKPYLIDTEKGSENKQYAKKLELAGGLIFRTNDFDELLCEVRELITLKHPYQTLVIDPLTTLYDDLLEKSEAKVGSDFGRHYAEANKKMKHLLKLITRLDMNVIITAHAKNEYGDGMKVIGQTFDCYKKLGYLFDLVIEIQKRGRDNRIGVIKKSRIEELPDGDQFPFSYDAIAEKYGRSILERDAVAEILATAEHVLEIKRLIDLLKVPEETVQKWLDKDGAETIEEMSFDYSTKCLNALISKMKGE
jgi:hypothetical protein